MLSTCTMLMWYGFMCTDAVRTTSPVGVSPTHSHTGGRTSRGTEPRHAPARRIIWQGASADVNRFEDS
eukprot:5414193-Prymnesium_polylepis.1